MAHQLASLPGIIAVQYHEGGGNLCEKRNKKERILSLRNSYKAGERQGGGVLLAPNLMTTNNTYPVHGRDVHCGLTVLGSSRRLIERKTKGFLFYTVSDYHVHLLLHSQLTDYHVDTSLDLSGRWSFSAFGKVKRKR